jgi:Mlc titration factor MtfA (ptsG expression regulator)
MTVDKRLAAALKAPFPEEWRVILHAIPFYRGLKEDERERFEEKLKIFVRTKEFVADEEDPVGIDDGLRVTIAATACRLTMNIPGEDYGRLERIHVRRGTFERGGDTLGGYADVHAVRLSWETLSRQLLEPRPQNNIAYHEFAHVLDMSDGTLDGRPPLLFAPALYRPWVRVLARHLESLRDAIAKQIPTLIGAYGAKNEGEFFAVATERFFESPVELRHAYPVLYKLLAAYFRQDPAADRAP